jgi:hypothetical protein
MGQTKKVVMSTALNSQEMLEILKRYFGSANLDIKLHGSILGLACDPKK